MLKRWVNECRFTLELIAKGPLLVREGRWEKEKDKKEKKDTEKKEFNPDSIPIRGGVWYGNKRDIPENRKDYGYLPENAYYYLPGTSIRGVLRSHAERIVRTVAPGCCCDPFQKSPEAPDRGCGFWHDDNKTPHKEAYSKSCVICRLFGSTGQASRIRLNDAQLVESTLKMGLRDHVGIDRFTGGAAEKVKFQDLVMEAGTTFTTQVVIRNFELWQLGLLAYVLRDLKCWQDGLIRVGAGKSKGYGLVEGKVNDLEVRYYGSFSPDRGLLDLGNLVPEEEVTAYDFQAGKCQEKNLLVKKDSTRLYCHAYEVIDEESFWKAAAQDWNQKITNGSFKTLSKLREAAATSAPEEES